MNIEWTCRQIDSLMDRLLDWLVEKWLHLHAFSVNMFEKLMERRWSTSRAVFVIWVTQGLFWYSSSKKHHHHGCSKSGQCSVQVNYSQKRRTLLVCGLEHFYFSIYIGNNHPNWRSYFSEGLKPRIWRGRGATLTKSSLHGPKLEALSHLCLST